MNKLKANLFAEMAKKGWNAYDLADKSGVPQPTIQRFLSGKHSDPRTKTVVKLAQGLGLTELELRGLAEPAKPKANAELLGGFEAWDNAMPLHNDEVELPFFQQTPTAAPPAVQINPALKMRFALATLKKKNVAPESAACVTVTGDSMIPVLPDGATVVIDTSQTAILNGEMYALEHGGELRVKVVYQLPGGGLRLRSFNDRAWPNEAITGIESEQLRILGRVFWYAVLL